MNENRKESVFQTESSGNLEGRAVFLDKYFWKTSHSAAHARRCYKTGGGKNRFHRKPNKWSQWSILGQVSSWKPFADVINFSYSCAANQLIESHLLLLMWKQNDLRDADTALFKWDGGQTSEDKLKTRSSDGKTTEFLSVKWWKSIWLLSL